MARPTKPKDLKPKAEAEVAAVPGGPSDHPGPALDIKYIVLVVVVIIASILGSAGSAYLMTTMFVMPEISKVAKQAPEEGEEVEGEEGEEGGEHAEAAGHHEVGMNLELDEFMVNLKPDPQLGGNQYLRAKMALSIKVPEKENCYVHAALLIPGGKIAGAAASVDRTTVASGGEGPSCEGIFKNNMGKFVPTMRDIINASLMKRTASLLATLEGQEALKDEIREQVNQVLAPNYEVLRVNFQDFIIQR